MIVSIHQLHYLPWLRYFHKLASSDIFVVLDNIQFNKNGWQNRNKIKTSQGPAILSVPILQKFAQPLSEVQIDNKQPWRRKHWGSISNAYRKAPFFQEHEAFFRGVYESEWEKLNDLNYEVLFYFVKALGIKTKIVKSSTLNLRGDASERLVSICQDLKAKSYLTGAFAAEEYLDQKIFEAAGISLKFQHFECPEYPQLFPEKGFIPELSMIDLLFNCGTKSLEVLMNGAGSHTVKAKA